MRLKHLIGLFSVGGGIALAAVACSTKIDETTGPTTAGPGSGGGGPGVGPASSTTGGGGMPDEGTSCADAVELMPVANGVLESSGVINPAGDTDFFKFTVSAANSWFAVVTEANPMDDPMKLDTVVTIYNEDGSTQLAEVDDSFPRYTTDTEIFHRFLAPGTYCLKVQEFSTWNQMAAEGDPTFTYAIRSIPMDPAVFSGYTPDTEPNDTSAEPQAEPHNYTVDMTSGMNFTRFMGVMEPGTDEDWYAITTPADPSPTDPDNPGLSMAINIDLTPSGNGSSGQQGYGSTKSLGIVTLYDATGTAIQSQVDASHFVDGLDNVYMPVEEMTDYFLRIQRPDDMVGANDFYLVKLGTQEALNPQELNEGGNSNLANPEVTVATPDGAVNRHFIGGLLSPGDVDYWVFDPAALPQSGEELIMVCSSRSAGSGVTDMKLTVETDAMVLQTQTEDQYKGVYWTSDPTPNATMGSIMLSGNGPFRVKVEATAVDATIANKSYLCGIHVGTFM